MPADPYACSFMGCQVQWGWLNCSLSKVIYCCECAIGLLRSSRVSATWEFLMYWETFTVVRYIVNICCWGVFIKRGSTVATKGWKAKGSRSSMCSRDRQKNDVQTTVLQTCMSHCIYLGDGEIDLFRNKQVGMAHCPNSNFRWVPFIAFQSLAMSWIYRKTYE